MDSFVVLCRVTEIDDEDIEKFREILKNRSSNKEIEKQKEIKYCPLVKLSIT